MFRPIIYESMRVLPGEQDVEVVERKGLGHPDTICDSVMESVAVRLAQAYLKRCGRVLHFNADKALLVAGQADYRFGGGRMLVPMRLVMGDRATCEWEDRPLPIARIARNAASDWFGRHLPKIRWGKDLECRIELRPAPAELRSVSEGRPEAVANDTSATVGYAPLTPTELLAFRTEQFLNGTAFKRQFPDTGQDVKVLAVRHGHHVTVTVAMPFVAPLVRSERQYFTRKAEVERALASFVKSELNRPMTAEVVLNALDRPRVREAGAYLTLLGTSAEAGDSGEVGRGNRVCGVISLFRPASAEATAGKNPVSHVGKIYNVLAQVLAENLYHKVPGVLGATVWITSRIGRPIASPETVVVEVSLGRGKTMRVVRDAIGQEIRQAFTRLPAFCRALAQGRYPVC